MNETFNKIFEISNKTIGSPSVGGSASLSRTQQVQWIIAYFIQWALILLTIFFFTLIIYGGYMWMTAQGNDEQVKKAQKILTRGIVGFIIVVLGLGITFMIMSVLEAQVMLL